MVGAKFKIPFTPAATKASATPCADPDGTVMTAVLDLSEFTEGEKIRFLAGHGSQDGFAYRFYRRKSEEQPPTHLFLEEADDYLPQKAMRDKAKLLHDVTRLFLWGRQRGVGGTLITQRSARIHKDSFSQIGTLFAFRTGDPRDQKAILDWVRYHGLVEEVMQSLSGLADGEGWVWSPEWLKVIKRVQFRQRATYDSGRTPELGARARAPATLADVDLGAIQTQMAATIEKARAEDPRELRKRIAELEKQLRVRPVETKPEVRVERVEVPVLKIGQLDKALRFADRLDNVLAQVSELAGSLKQSIARAARPAAAPPAERKKSAVPPTTSPAVRAATPRCSDPGETGLGCARQRILDALAWLEGVRVPQAKRTQLALLAEQSPTSSAFGNNLGAPKKTKRACIRGRSSSTIPAQAWSVSPTPGGALPRPLTCRRQRRRCTKHSLPDCRRRRRGFCKL